MTRATLWTRPDFKSSQATVDFDLFAFSRQPIATSLGSFIDDDWHPYGQWPDWLEMTLLSREQPQAQPLFDALVGPKPMGVDSIKDFPRVADRFARASHCCNVTIKRADPPDLGHLQAGWAAARWLVRAGAFAVFDDAAKLWHLAEEILGWPTPLTLSMERETRLTYETDSAPGRGHMLHTRGMQKFGRPDLVMELPAELGVRWQVEQANGLLTSLSEAAARGHLFLPGRTVTLGEALFSLERYEPGVNAPNVFLQNEGLLVRRLAP